MAKVWKAVRVEDGGKFVSWGVIGFLRKYYDLGKTTRPEVGYLFAYSSLEAAESHIRSGEAVLEGDGVIVAGTCDYFMVPEMPQTLSIEKLEDFWRTHCTPDEHTWPTPQNTVFLEEFTPECVIERK